MEHARPVPERYPRMPMEKRAAQFSPFKALTGYEDEVEETARYVEEKRVLSEDRLEELDRRLRCLREGCVRLTYFEPDERKNGGQNRNRTPHQTQTPHGETGRPSAAERGSFVTISGKIRKIDAFHRRLIMDDGSMEGLSIPFDDIYEIEEGSASGEP